MADKARDFILDAIFVIVPIILSFLLTAAMVLLLGQDPIKVFDTLWSGAFKQSSNIASVFNFWIPLTLASIGLVITFKAGLWNIGVEGQIVMGAIFASWGALYLDLPRPILLPALIILSGVGGAMWAFLAGILKTRLGVHEIFGGVALNATANNIAIYLIAGPWQPPEGGGAQSTPPFPDAAWLGTYSQDFAVPLLMLILTIICLIVVFFILNFTRWGLELKATGNNARSALLLGVATERVSLLAFATCGMLAGFAGAHRVLHTYHALRPLVAGGIGFLGLLVVLLVGFHIVLVPFVAFIGAALFTGSTRVKVLLRIDQSLVGVLQGIVVLMILFSSGVRSRFFKRQSSTNTNTSQASLTENA